MHKAVEECQSTFNGTVVAAMKKLEEVAGAADFAAAKTAAMPQQHFRHPYS